MRIMRVIGCLALLAGAIFLGLASANAQGSADAQQACTGDAMRLCADAIPDVPKVTACMKSKYRQLSPPCRLVMAGGGSHVTRHRQVRAAHCDPFSHMCS